MKTQKFHAPTSHQRNLWMELCVCIYIYLNQTLPPPTFPLSSWSPDGYSRELFLFHYFYSLSLQGLVLFSFLGFSFWDFSLLPFPFFFDSSPDRLGCLPESDHGFYPDGGYFIRNIWTTSPESRRKIVELVLTLEFLVPSWK